MHVFAWHEAAVVCPLRRLPTSYISQGRGVPRDDAAALAYYTLSSAQGDQVSY
jgi:hypothetical protein